MVMFSYILDTFLSCKLRVRVVTGRNQSTYTPIFQPESPFSDTATCSFTYSSAGSELRCYQLSMVTMIVEPGVMLLVYCWRLC